MNILHVSKDEVAAQKAFRKSIEMNPRCGFNMTNMVLHREGAQIIFQSMEKKEKLRGMRYDFMIVDEFAKLSDLEHQLLRVHTR